MQAPSGSVSMTRFPADAWRLPYFLVFHSFLFLFFFLFFTPSASWSVLFDRRRTPSSNPKQTRKERGGKMRGAWLSQCVRSSIVFPHLAAWELVTRGNVTSCHTCHIALWPRDLPHLLDCPLFWGLTRSNMTTSFVALFWSSVFHKRMWTTQMTADNKLFIPGIKELQQPSSSSSLIHNLSFEEKKQCPSLTFRNQLQTSFYLLTIINCISWQ